MSIIDTKEQSGFIQFSFFEQGNQNQLPESAPKNTSSTASICYIQTRQGNDEDSLISTNSSVKFYARFGLQLSLLAVWISFFTSLCDNFSPLLSGLPLSPFPLSTFFFVFALFTIHLICCLLLTQGKTNGTNSFKR